MAAWGAPDSQRGSAEGSRSSMSSHMPSGMTGLPSILQGTLLQPAALCIGVKAGLHGALASWPQDPQSYSAMVVSSEPLVPQIDNIVCKATDLHSVICFPLPF